MKKFFLPLVLVITLFFTSCYSNGVVSSQTANIDTSSVSVSSENTSSSISRNETSSLAQGDNKVSSIYTPKPLDIKEIKKSNKEKIKKIIDKKTDSDMTNIEKANVIYNWLFTNFGYRTVFIDTTNGINRDQTHNLAHHYFRYYRGSCEHYAAVSKLFFEELGFECKYVFGSRYSSISYKWSEHVWLMIKVDGNWYHVDGLFAGFFADNMNDYFCVPDKKINQTHKWDKKSLPECKKSQFKI